MKIITIPDQITFFQPNSITNTNYNQQIITVKQKKKKQMSNLCLPIQSKTFSLFSSVVNLQNILKSVHFGCIKSSQHRPSSLDHEVLIVYSCKLKNLNNQPNGGTNHKQKCQLKTNKVVAIHYIIKKPSTQHDHTTAKHECRLT